MRHEKEFQSNLLPKAVKVKSQGYIICLSTDDYRYLDSIQSRIYEIFQTLVSSGTEFEGENIKARYLGHHIEQGRMLMEVYEAHNLEFKQLVGKGFSYKTLQKYRTIKG